MYSFYHICQIHDTTILREQNKSFSTVIKKTHLDRLLIVP